MRAQYHSSRKIFGILLSPLILWVVILLIDAAMSGYLTTTTTTTTTEVAKNGILQALYDWNPYLKDYVNRGQIPDNTLFFTLAVAIVVISAVFSLLLVAGIERNRLFESRQAENILGVIVILLVLLATKTKMFAIMTSILLLYGEWISAVVLFAITGLLLLVSGRGVYTGVRSVGAAEAWVRKGALRARKEVEEVVREEERLLQEEVRKAREELQLLNLDTKIEQTEIKNIHELVNELNNLKILIKKYGKALNDPNFRGEILSLLEKIRNKTLELHKEINEQLKLEVQEKKDDKLLKYSTKNIIEEYRKLDHYINEITRKYSEKTRYKAIINKIKHIGERLRSLDEEIGKLDKNIKLLGQSLIKGDKEALNELNKLVRDTEYIKKVRTIPLSEISRIINEIDHLQKTLLFIQSTVTSLYKTKEELEKILVEFVRQVSEIKGLMKQIEKFNKTE